MQGFDVIVVGGGMAGVSIGYELALDRRVLILETEPTLAFHTTGRSAAMFLESYGNLPIRALTTASRSFLEAAADQPLLRPLPMMHVGRTGRGQVIETLHHEVSALVPGVVLLDPGEAAAVQPLLRATAVDLALLEPAAMEIDVHALHQLFLRGLRARGGQVSTRTGVASASRVGDAWTVTSSGGDTWQAPVVVDAAGAWADRVAQLFAAPPVGIRPLRRTAFIVDAPAGAGPPMIADIDDAFYIKPDAGRLLCSPADETPQDPADARADELEIARALDVIREVTTLDVRHVRSSWAGLRTFVTDRTPVVGYDPVATGLFWFAAQGGYGIQIAPALARTGAALVRGERVPDDVAGLGLNAAALAPDRPGLR